MQRRRLAFWPESPTLSKYFSSAVLWPGRTCTSDWQVPVGWSGGWGSPSRRICCHSRLDGYKAPPPLDTDTPGWLWHTRLGSCCCGHTSCGSLPKGPGHSDLEVSAGPGLRVELLPGTSDCLPVNKDLCMGRPLMYAD